MAEILKNSYDPPERKRKRISRRRRVKENNINEGGFRV
jgi:hypothetical protein